VSPLITGHIGVHLLRRKQAGGTIAEPFCLSGHVEGDLLTSLVKLVIQSSVGSS
jgi:hypothetical protein